MQLTIPATSTGCVADTQLHPSHRPAGRETTIGTYRATTALPALRAGRADRESMVVEEAELRPETYQRKSTTKGTLECPIAY
jgi:hypothetical protein